MRWCMQCYPHDVIVCIDWLWLSGGNRNGKRVQPVEQARPSNLSEEEMQLKLALQLSKQQADEEATLR